eukprot:1537376-Amphidinium_carterae.2
MASPSKNQLWVFIPYPDATQLWHQRRVWGRVQCSDIELGDMYVTQSPDNDIYIENYGVGGDVLAAGMQVGRRSVATACKASRPIVLPIQSRPHPHPGDRQPCPTLQAVERFLRKERTARGVP